MPLHVRLLPLWSLLLVLLAYGPAGAESQEAPTRTTAGTGQYVVEGQPQRELRQLKTSLSRMGAARLEAVDKEGRSLVLSGTWKTLGAQGVGLTLQSGPGGRPIEGEGMLVLKADGTSVDLVELDFTESGGTVLHRLMFKSAK